MKTTSLNSILIVVAAIFTTVIAGSVWSTPGLADGIIAAPRAPIAFEPFTLKDASGNPVDALTTVTLPGVNGAAGRTVNAGEHLRQMNSSEQYLNGYGYTLRHPDEIPAELYASVANPDEVAAQKAAIAETTVKMDPEYMAVLPDREALEKVHADSVMNESKPTLAGLIRMSVPPTESLEGIHRNPEARSMNGMRAMSFGAEANAESATSSSSASYNDGCQQVAPGEGCMRREEKIIDLGKRDTVFVTAGVHMEVRGNERHTRAEAEAGFEAGVLNTPFRILHALAQVDGDDVTGDSIHVEATKLGEKVVNFNLSSGSALTNDQSVPLLEIDKVLIRQVFVIVVVPVTVTAGVRARGEIAWQTPAAYSHVAASVSPRALAAAYAQAAIGIGVEAGVEGEVTLIEDTLRISGYIKARMSPIRGPFFEAMIGATNTLDALRGMISLYAKYPCGVDAGLWPPSLDLKWCTTKYGIIGWDPVHLDDSSLFNNKYTWWLGNDAVAGGSTSDDAQTAALAKAEEDYARLIQHEQIFYKQLRDFMHAVPTATLKTRLSYFIQNQENAISQTVTLAEKLRNDISGSQM